MDSKEKGIIGGGIIHLSKSPRPGTSTARSGYKKDIKVTQR